MQQLQVRKASVPQGVLNWLLEEDEPSVRYETLVRLQDRGEDEKSVVSTKDRIGRVGFVAEIFAKQKENTYWDNSESCYVPKFSASGWQMAVVADLGASSNDIRVKNAIDHYLQLHNVETGGFSLRPRSHEKFEPHICLTGNMVRALTKIGFARDDRVENALTWLLSKQLSDGGWNCSPPGKHGSFMATVEPLWALSEMISQNPSAEWKESAQKASEFLLKHRVFRSDLDDSVIMFDFLKTHYPTHYCYDFLHGLRVLTELGVRDDFRMDDAVNLLLEKRLPDGKWVLDGVYRGWRHPHAMHGQETVSRPEERELITTGWGTERTLQLEEAGKPSKWITLQALLILKRLGILDIE